MDDLISRQAAIDCVNRAVTKEVARWAIKELPSAQPKRTEERTETHSCDCISREDAKWVVFCNRDHVEDQANAIDSLPCVQPSTQPQHEVRFSDADHVWIDGKQYISLRRFMEAVKDARKDAYKHGKSKGIKKGLAMAQRIKGRWIKISPAGIYECSICGKNVMTSDIDAYDYCHGCGNPMEVIRDENQTSPNDEVN